MPAPLRDCPPRLFTYVEQSESVAQTDMQIRGARLARFVAACEGKVWQAQENGEWWLVPVIDGTTFGAPTDSEGPE